MSRLAAICFLLLGAQASFAQSAPQLTPAQILARVGEVYASCHSYSDEGETSTVMAMPGKPEPGTAQPFMERFSTMFVRPDSFRFEFYFGPLRPDGRFIAWKAGQLERSYWPEHRYDLDNLDEMLVRMYSPSRGSSLRVPALLMPAVFHGKGLFAYLTDLKLGVEERIGGRRTFKIEARFDNHPLNIWIDRSQFLILQVQQVTGIGQMHQFTTTRYRPVLNADISADRLSFNAPGIVQPDDGAVNTRTDTPVRSAPELKSNARPRLKTFGSSVYLTSEEIERLRKQRERQGEDEDVVRVDTDMVVSDVLVIDPKGRPVQGLTPRDFVVKEDDQPQEIGSVSLGNSDEVPRSIVLIIDYSNSQLPYVITSVEAAKTLVDKLKRRDRMALVTDDVKVLVDFTSDKAVLKAQLDALKERAMNGQLGRSQQYDALMAALRELFNGEEERPIVIFQTDGDSLDGLGMVTPPELLPYFPPKTFTFEDLLIAAERVRVTIYSIIPGVPMIGVSGQELIERSRRDWDNRMKAADEIARLRNLPVRPPSPPTDEFLLRNAGRWSRLQVGVVNVAKATGGWADYLEKPEQADSIYTHILSDINQRYVIAYYPKNRVRDGKRRKVSFEVRGHPEYTILGRRSYFAPQP